MFKDLLNKKITIPTVKTPHIDNSTDYTTIKKTKKGVVKVIKPELLQEIKSRLNS